MQVTKEEAGYIVRETVRKNNQVQGKKPQLYARASHTEDIERALRIFI